MKIGIMTFWESKNNYGQILQLFALQSILKSMGHQPFLIKYHRLPTKKNGVLKKKITFQKVLNLLRKKLFGDKDFERRFFEFKKEKIIFGDKDYFSYESLKKDPPELDMMIVGSDQVWNNNFSSSAEPFMLGFGSPAIKRISYAASFGQSKLDDKTMKLFQRYINKINAIGVREKSGVEVCEDLGRFDAEWVLDPTLLFNKNEWEEMLGLGSSNQLDRVFIYTLGNSRISEKDKYLKFVEEMEGYSILHASANNDYSGDFYPTIPQWVEGIFKSKFVITTSFHGMVFCIISNTNFVVLPNTGEASGMNERIESLLSLIGMEEHFFKKYDELLLRKIFNKKIDWDFVNTVINQEKTSSLNFLIKNLS